MQFLVFILTFIWSLHCLKEFEDVWVALLLSALGGVFIAVLLAIITISSSM